MSDVMHLSERARQAKQLIYHALGSKQCCARIDQLVHSAAVTLGADIASLSMLSDRQITLSACGRSSGMPVLPRGFEAAFEDTICATALRLDTPLVIPDTRADSRVSSVPIVQSGLVGAYLGSLLRHDGAVVGVLCACTEQPRQWQDADSATLDRIAADIVHELVCYSAAARTV